MTEATPLVITAFCSIRRFDDWVTGRTCGPLENCFTYFQRFTFAKGGGRLKRKPADPSSPGKTTVKWK